MVKTANPEALENHLHQYCSASRVPQSEWFSLNEEDLRSVCELLTNAHEADNYVILPFESEIHSTDDLSELLERVDTSTLEIKKLRKELEDGQRSKYAYRHGAHKWKKRSEKYHSQAENYKSDTMYSVDGDLKRLKEAAKAAMKAVRVAEAPTPNSFMDRWRFSFRSGKWHHTV